MLALSSFAITASLSSEVMTQLLCEFLQYPDCRQIGSTISRTPSLYGCHTTISPEGNRRMNTGTRCIEIFSGGLMVVSLIVKHEVKVGEHGQNKYIETV